MDKAVKRKNDVQRWKSGVEDVGCACDGASRLSLVVPLGGADWEAGGWWS